MTAFNEILTTEQEAQKSIETATSEVAIAIDQAHANGKTRIQTESASLQEAEKKQLASHKSSIAELTKKIDEEVAGNVSATEKRFETHTAELTTELKKRFV